MGTIIRSQRRLGCSLGNVWVYSRLGGSPALLREQVGGSILAAPGLRVIEGSKPQRDLGAK